MSVMHTDDFGQNARSVIGLAICTPCSCLLTALYAGHRCLANRPGLVAWELRDVRLNETGFAEERALSALGLPAYDRDRGSADG